MGACFQFGEMLPGACPSEGGSGGLELNREIAQFKSYICVQMDLLSSPLQEVLLVSKAQIIDETNKNLEINSNLWNNNLLL